MQGMCLQLQILTEKDKGHGWGEIPGPHFSCCSCGLKPLNLARLPKRDFTKLIVFPGVSPAALLPPALSAFLSLLPQPQEKCSMGKSRSPTAMVLEAFVSCPGRPAAAAAAGSRGWRARGLGKVAPRRICRPHPCGPHPCLAAGCCLRAGPAHRSGPGFFLGRGKRVLKPERVPAGRLAGLAGNGGTLSFRRL